MKDIYSIEEIIELAIQIEVNGEKFYTKASEVLPTHADFLKRLAHEELRHKRFFFDLKKKIVGQTKYDFDEQHLGYLHSIVDDQIFHLKEPIEKFFTKSVTLEDVINDALKREKNAILLFLGLSELLNNKKDKEIVNQILSEELKHVADLSKQLKP